VSHTGPYSAAAPAICAAGRKWWGWAPLYPVSMRSSCSLLGPCLLVLLASTPACSDDDPADPADPSSASGAQGGSGAEGAAGPGGAGGSGAGTSSGGAGGCSASCADEPLFALRAGGAGDQTAGVSSDGDDGWLVGCELEGELSLPGVEAITAGGEKDGCAFSLAADGTARWLKGFGATNTVGIYGRSGAGPIALGDGDVFLGVNFEGNVDLGGGPLPESLGVDVAMGRFGGDGTAISSASTQAADDQQVLEMIPAPGGAVLVAGTYGGTFGPLTSVGNWDAWVALIPESGTPLWHRSYGGPGYDGIYGLSPAQDGGAFIAGGFEASIDFGSGEPLIGAGGFDCFLAHIDGEGNAVWSKRFGDDKSIVNVRLVTAPDGDLVMALASDQVIDFGGGALTPVGGIDTFVARFAETGELRWAKRFGEADTQLAVALAVDAAGNILVGADVHGAIDFGGGTLTSAGEADVGLVKLTGEGEHVWSRLVGDAADQNLASLATDADGNVALSGRFEGTMAFGATELVSAGGYDLFVAVLPP
jgi:hypothetical protein